MAGGRLLLDSAPLMRMLHYFLAFAMVYVPALGWTTYLGMTGSPKHLPAGLVTAILGVALHTLLLLFMILTGRILKEAMRARPLSNEYLEELNGFFARKSAYPLAIIGSFSITTAAVLCLLYTSPSPRDQRGSRMPSSA